MALAFRIAKIEDVAEAFRSLYVKTENGSYVLEVDGAVPKERLDEFRQKNIDLLKEADKYKDLNPEKYAELMELQRKREEKELLDKGEIDTVIANRVAAMKTEYEGKLGEVTKANSQMNRQLESLLIDNTVRVAAGKTGVRPEAVDDVLLRAKTMFQIKDGNVVALDEKGAIKYGKDGTTPLGIEEWSAGLKTQAPHLYLGSNGGGANTGAGGGGSGGSMSSATKGVGKIAASLAEGGLPGMG